MTYPASRTLYVPVSRFAARQNRSPDIKKRGVSENHEKKKKSRVYFDGTREKPRQEKNTQKSVKKKTQDIVAMNNTSLDIEQQLLIPLQSDVEVVVAHQRGLVSSRLVLVRQLRLLPWWDLEPFDDPVIEALE